MTNEEKALELVGGNWRVFNKEYQAAINMGEWKDRMFDSAIIHFYHLIQDGISFERAYKQVTGREWNAQQTEEKAWCKWIDEFEEGSDDWRDAHRILQKYHRQGYDIDTTVEEPKKEFYKTHKSKSNE